MGNTTNTDTNANFFENTTFIDLSNLTRFWSIIKTYIDAYAPALLEEYDKIFATVAKTGSYNDLTNKPNIPVIESIPTTDIESLTYKTTK